MIISGTNVNALLASTCKRTECLRKQQRNTHKQCKTQKLKTQTLNTPRN